MSSLVSNQNWDIVTQKGAFAYGYFDAEVGCMKVQYHDQKIDIPMVSYNGLIGYVMREECDEELYENYTMMSSEKIRTIKDSTLNVIKF